MNAGMVKPDHHLSVHCPVHLFSYSNSVGYDMTARCLSMILWMMNTDKWSWLVCPACVLRPFKRWSDQLRRDSTALKAFISHMYLNLLRCCSKSKSKGSSVGMKSPNLHILFFIWFTEYPKEKNTAQEMQSKKMTVGSVVQEVTAIMPSRKKKIGGEQCGEDFSARRSDATYIHFPALLPNWM